MVILSVTPFLKKKTELKNWFWSGGNKQLQIILLRIIQRLKVSVAGMLVSFWVEEIQTIFLTAVNRW